MEEKCENCKYWKNIGTATFEKKKKESGQCRRHSPEKRNSGTMGEPYSNRFPTSAVDDWCGEYVPKDEQKE